MHAPPHPETRARRVARRLLVAFYGLAGVMHFVAVEAMMRIVPTWVPAPRAAVLLTGIAELIAAVGLTTRRWRIAAGLGLAAYALCVWPANVGHAMLDLAELGGSGTGLSAWYHYPRLALQPAIVWWALWASGALRSRGARRA